MNLLTIIPYYLFSSTCSIYLVVSYREMKPVQVSRTGKSCCPVKRKRRKEWPIEIWRFDLLWKMWQLQLKGNKLEGVTRINLSEIVLISRVYYQMICVEIKEMNQINQEGQGSLKTKVHMGDWPSWRPSGATTAPASIDLHTWFPQNQRKGNKGKSY